MKLTATQAAKEVGKSTPTITRAIKTGRLSATLNDKKQYEIEPSELFRVYPRVTGDSNTQHKMLRDATPQSNNVLQLEIDMLKQRLSEKNGIIEDIKKERDEWRITCQKSHNLLEHQNKRSTKGWFNKLFNDKD